MARSPDSMQAELAGGIVPAVVNPWTPEYDLVAGDLADHVERLASVDGVVAIICNAHAGECKLTTRDVKREVLRTADDVLDDVPLLAGVGGESTLQTIELARDAERAGADGLMLLPLDTYSKGVAAEPIRHFRMVADEVDLPLVNFQFPTWGGPGVPISAHAEICAMDQVVGFKEASFDPVRTERTVRELDSLRDEFTLLAGSDTFLLHSYLMGADSALISYGNLIPELHVEKLRAVKRGDLDRAREIRREMLPLTNLLFDDPQGNYLPRVKSALEMMGTYEHATILPPQEGIDAEERGRLRNVLTDLGVL